MIHIDALWEIADLLTDDDFPMTPLEAFVLGGAFLLHDLGLALVAYPGGLAGVRRESYWRESVARSLRSSLNRIPSSEEIDAPAEAIANQATEATLRHLHAEKATNLATVAFQYSPRDTQFFLIDDPDLRETYGNLIGRIARSHWSDLEQVVEDFPVTLGSDSTCPQSWTIDPLKIACLLRVCDACHLDARRAPALLRALKKPQGNADLHWRFSGFIQKPHVEHGRLHFTSTRPFRLRDFDAWWLGYDLVRQAHRELGDVDGLLRESGRCGLQAHGVANVQSPLRLSKHLKTEGWKAVDIAVRITDVTGIVQTLGGGQPYGSNATIPLRELIQNARDAVVARRVLEDRADDWGKIFVRLLSENDTHWLEVEDTGLGMSEAVLSGPLTDFGKSYWTSDLAVQEWPGLLASTFWPTGARGRGFFSVFMVGEYVSVITRPSTEGATTNVLEFPQAHRSRLILRSATRVEQRNDPGTLVRIRLRTKPTDRGGIIGPMRFETSPFDSVSKESGWTLKDLCEWLCPALDVDLHTVENGSEQCAVKANDWQTIPPEALIRRTILHREDCEQILALDLMGLLLKNLRPVMDPQGHIIGRACLWPNLNFVTDIPAEWASVGKDTLAIPRDWASKGLITAGSFRGSLTPNAIGLWPGRSRLATPYRSDPVALDAPLELLTWASDQADLLSTMNLDVFSATHGAAVIRSIGADTGSLPIAIDEKGFVSFNDLSARSDLPTEVVLFPTDPMFGDWFTGPPFGRQLRVDRRVLPGTFGVLSLRMRAGLFRALQDDPLNRSNHTAWRRFWMSIWGATLEAVALAWGVSLDEMLAVSDIPDRTHFFNAPIGVDVDGNEIRSEAVDILRKPARIKPARPKHK